MKKLRNFIIAIVVIAFIGSTMDIKKMLFGLGVATGVIPKSMLEGKGAKKGGMPPTLVSTQILKKAEGHSYSSYTGLVRYADVSTLSAKVSGSVESIKLKEGSSVKKGQTIIQLEDGRTYQDMLAAKANNIQANLAYKQAHRDYVRVKALFARQAVSKQELETSELKLSSAESQASSARANFKKLKLDLKYKHIESPYDGIYISRDVEIGEYVNIGTKVAVVANTSKLKVETEVPYNTFITLKKGMVVSVKIKGKTYKGTIYSTVSSSDAVSRSFPVKVWLDKTEGLYDGMEASVFFPNSVSNNAGYEVSRDSIIRINGIDSIYILKGNLAIPTAVNIVKFDGKDVIISGESLNDKTRVVIAGNERLMPNMPVRIDGNKKASTAPKPKEAK